jgi:uncharacterized membrane protein YuzA (DUF378 family)
MSKHKPMCWLVSLLVFVGALNWGLVGLGLLIEKNLNLVNLLVGRWSLVESIVYLLVGLAGILMLVFFLKTENCDCQKMDNK